MKNHFYIPYVGNKRAEVQTILNNINLDNVTTIIEPFCGSCSMSYYIWINNKDKNYKYVLNDNNPYLLEMYKIIKSAPKIKKLEKDYTKTVNSFYKDGKYNKDKYKDIIKQKNLMGWLITNKIYGVRPGMCPLDDKVKSSNELNLTSYPVYNFFNEANIEFTNDNWYKCFNKYENNDNCLFLFDPPYLIANNDFYNDPTVDIYQYFFHNNYKNHKNKIYFILEKMWIMELLFNGWGKFEYPKKYTSFKKKLSTHVIYKNIPNE